MRPWVEWRRQLGVTVLFILIWHFGLLILRRILPTYTGESVYFPRELVKREEILNAKRAAVAQGIWENSKYTTKENFDLEVRVIASNRQRDYLVQVIGYLLGEYGNQSVQPPKIVICNVEPFLFKELYQYSNKIDIKTFNGDSAIHFGLNHSIAKENADYWKCLSFPTTSSFVLLLEDDALIVPGFAKLLQSLFIQLEKKPSIDFVKLYHPNPLRKIPSIPITVAVCVGVCSIVQYFLWRRFIWKWWIFTIFVMYLSLRSYGSQLPADLRLHLTGSAYLTYPESCCTPAVLFRSSRIDTMVNYFTSQKSFAGHAKDHILDESPFLGRQTDTNLVAHIGSFSSVRKRKVDLNEVKAVMENVNTG